MNIRFPKEFIARDESLDFKDDGSSFKGYKYKGVVPITYLRHGNDIYCSIRLDYLLSYDTYANEPVHKLAQEFNGVFADRFNMTKFLANCEEAFLFYHKANTPEFKVQKIQEEIAKIDAQVQVLLDRRAAISNQLMTIPKTA